MPVGLWVASLAPLPLHREALGAQALFQVSLVVLGLLVVLGSVEVLVLRRVVVALAEGLAPQPPHLRVAQVVGLLSLEAAEVALLAQQAGPMGGTRLPLRPLIHQ